MLTVGGERHVLGGQGPRRADLSGLLAEQGGPQAKLALALQRDRLAVYPADKHHVAVHALDIYVAQGIVGMLDPLALGR